MKTQGANKDVVFLSGVRTGFGAFGGSLKDLSAIDLGAAASRHAIQRAGVPATELGHGVFGNALQTSADAIYMARHVGLKAGLPIETPAVTVNRLCGSGFEAITQGAQLILLGEAEAVLAGGAESMSQAPHVVRGARWGALRLGDPAGAFEDLLWAALTDTHCALSMAQTAEKLAERYGVTREEADEIAYRSHRRAAAAWDDNRFQAEVVPVPVETRKGTVSFTTDEHIRRDTTPEGLAALRPAARLEVAEIAVKAPDGQQQSVVAGIPERAPAGAEQESEDGFHGFGVHRSIRSSMALSPRARAMLSALRPRLSARLGSAPRSNNRLASSQCALAAATMSALEPSESVSLALAPASRSAFTASTFPFEVAWTMGGICPFDWGAM